VEAALLDLPVSSENLQAATAIAFASRNISPTTTVSYLPIAPPEWCRLPQDQPCIPFYYDNKLPETFALDSESRCSCGGTTWSDDITITNYTVYTVVTAMNLSIQTSYCPLCSNTKGRVGPDLGRHGILNWNNKIGFSHDLLDLYTHSFTTSETPFHAFHQTIRGLYERNQSPMPACSQRAFLCAWFAYVRLQQIGSNMQCSQCGPNPPTVIADGISISFAKHRIQSLCPPTESDKLKAWVKLPRRSPKTTCFTGPRTIRISIQKALDNEDMQAGKEKLLSILQNMVR